SFFQLAISVKLELAWCTLIIFYMLITVTTPTTNIYSRQTLVKVCYFSNIIFQLLNLRRFIREHTATSQSQPSYSISNLKRKWFPLINHF
ncbi:hypothetical protein MKX01_032790, partial [Papaver californicum]